MDSDFQLKIHEDRKRLQNPYAHVTGDGTFDALPRSSTSAERMNLRSIRRRVKEAGRLSRPKIEAIARDLQAQLWRARESLFPDGIAVDALTVLDPFVALRYIGFRPELVESLDPYSWGGELDEVAGIIDRPARSVKISRRFPSPVRKFTAAHELGHALLHDGEELHRDRAPDRIKSGIPRDRTEFEADAFATYFLMPEKQVRFEFESAFKAREFVLNEDTTFALNIGALDEVLASYQKPRELSKLLARTTYYDGVPFCSLAEQFDVSVEAMAIRLEELKIIGQ